MDSHVSVTIKFKGTDAGVDLRIPTHISVSQLVKIVLEALKLPDTLGTYNRIRVTNKRLMLFDSQRLSDYYITNGDEIEIF